MQWSILQHYEVCGTPLIDFTHSFRVACSFAQLENESDRAYIYVFGLPYITNRISINSEHDLINIRLLSISFSVIFKDRVSGNSISAYIPKASIADYYKKTDFEGKMREFIDSDEDIDCFFLSAYPQLKTVQHNGKEFDVYNIEINNLDHFMLRIAE